MLEIQIFLSYFLIMNITKNNKRRSLVLYSMPLYNIYGHFEKYGVGVFVYFLYK